MGNFKEHGVMLYLSKELYSAWIKLQADKDLGRTYAGLLPFVEGLYRLGYLSPVVYEEYIRKYSQPLNVKNEQTSDEKKQSEFLKEKDKQFKGMLESWDLEHYNLNWHEKAVAEAKKFPNLEYAKLLIAKGKDCDVISQEGDF